MMKSIQTSIDALKKQVSSGKLQSNAAKALKIAMNDSPLNYPKLKSTHGMKMATATSTITKLLDLGLINVIGQTNIDDYECNQYGYVHNIVEQRTLAGLRRLEKYEQWKKRGAKEFSDLIKIDMAKGQSKYGQFVLDL